MIQDKWYDWCGVIQYPGKKEVLGGTLIMDAAATSEEILIAFKNKFDEYLPDGYKVNKLLRGSVWFTPASENT